MNKRILSVIVLSSVSFHIYAASPVGNGGWSANLGNIDTSVSCSAPGVQCVDLVADDGFLYQEVITPDYEYRRVIVTDEQVTGNADTLNFSTETIVPFATDSSGGFKQGIAAKQIVRDGTDFSTIAEIQKADLRIDGAATPEDMYATNILQVVNGTDMTSTFSTKSFTEYAGFPDSNIILGRVQDLEQTITIKPADATPEKKQLMVQRVREGYAGNTSSPWWGFRSPLTDGGSVTLGGTQVDWVTSDKVSSTWIVQHDASDMGEAVAVSKQIFSKDDGFTPVITAEDMLFDVAEPVNPFAWTPDLGAEPVF